MTILDPIYSFKFQHPYFVNSNVSFLLMDGEDALNEGFDFRIQFNIKKNDPIFSHFNGRLPAFFDFLIEKRISAVLDMKIMQWNKLADGSRQMLEFFNQYVGILKEVFLTHERISEGSYDIECRFVSDIHQLARGKRTLIYASDGEDTIKDESLAGTDGIRLSSVLEQVFQRNQWEAEKDYVIEFSEFSYANGIYYSPMQLIRSLSGYAVSNAMPAALSGSYSDMSKRRLFFQYNETDYDFLLRICEEEGIIIGEEVVELKINQDPNKKQAVKQSKNGQWYLEVPIVPTGITTQYTEASQKQAVNDIVNIIDSGKTQDYIHKHIDNMEEEERLALFALGYGAEELGASLPDPRKSVFMNSVSKNLCLYFEVLDNTHVEFPKDYKFYYTRLRISDVQNPILRNLSPSTASNKLSDVSVSMFDSYRQTGFDITYGLLEFYKQEHKKLLEDSKEMDENKEKEVNIIIQELENREQQLIDYYKSNDGTIEDYRNYLLETMDNVFTSKNSIKWPVTYYPGIQLGDSSVRDLYEFHIISTQMPSMVVVGTRNPYADIVSSTHDYAPLAAGAWNIYEPETNGSFISLEPPGLIESVVGTGFKYYFGENVETTPDAKRIAVARLEMLKTEAFKTTGRSSSIDMRSGSQIAFLDYSQEVNQAKLGESVGYVYIHSVCHKGYDAKHFAPGSGRPQPSAIVYENTFTSINTTDGHNLAFRPLMKRERPKIKGPIHGVIAGGVEIEEEVLTTPNDPKEAKKHFAQKNYGFRFNDVSGDPEEAMQALFDADVEFDKIKKSFPKMDSFGRYWVSLDLMSRGTERFNQSITVPIPKREFYSDGLSHGGFHMPLLRGTEVLIDFHEGNPFEPYIIGVLPKKQDTANLESVMKNVNDRVELMSSRGGTNIAFKQKEFEEVITVAADLLDLKGLKDEKGNPKTPKRTRQSYIKIGTADNVQGQEESRGLHMVTEGALIREVGANAHRLVMTKPYREKLLKGAGDNPEEMDKYYRLISKLPVTQNEERAIYSANSLSDNVLIKHEDMIQFYKLQTYSVLGAYNLYPMFKLWVMGDTVSPYDSDDESN